MNNLDEEIKTGIKACSYSVDGAFKYTVTKNSVLYLQADRTHRFYLTDEDQLFGLGTRNTAATIATAKWAHILASLWAETEKTPAGEELQVWSGIFSSLESVGYLGIGHRYKTGDFIEFKPSAGDKPWLGNFYRVEVFNYIPNRGLNFDFMVVDKPQIYISYFDKQDIQPITNGPEINDGYYSYGQVVKLHVWTHLLPMKINADYHIKTETSFKNLQVAVYITDEAGKKLDEEPILKGDLEQYCVVAAATTSTRISVSAANLKFEFPIQINPEWKDKIHHKSDKIFTYYAFVVIRNTETGAVYEKQTKENYISQVAESHREFENKEVSPSFMVKYESFDIILDQFEKRKGNLIQYIGDIQYKKKEYDPCGYSKIILKDETDTNRTPFVIFDEDAEVMDHTEQSFDVIAEDEKKKISITVERLINKGVPCTGVLLPIGQKHDAPPRVFLMDRALVPARTPDGKYYATRKDPTQKDDTDVYADERLNPSDDVSDVQGLIIGEDYEYKGDNKLELKLRYLYNKSYDDTVLNYLSTQKAFSNKEIYDNLKNIWVVRYLINAIKGKDLFQRYFIPVSTCRYPNQLARIRVFPDMKWVINFNYNITKPIFYAANTELMEHYSGFNEGKINTSNNNTRKNITDKLVTSGLQPYVGRKTSFGLYVECEINGASKVKLGDEFGEKYRKMLKPLLWIVNKLDGDLGISDAKKEEEKIRLSGKTGLMARLNKLPMSFELEAPKIGLGVGIGYHNATSGKVAYALEGRLITNPLIGANVTLDVLALGSKLKPWGLIIDALDLASWLTNAFSGGRIELEYKIEVRFTAQIKLCGKKTGTDPETGEEKYEEQCNVKYNFLDKKLDFDGSIQGEIKGEIEISASVKLQANVSDAQGKKIDDKYNIAEAGIGAKASSYIKLTCPFELNQNGNLDVDFYFSGVKLEIWFKGNINSKDADDEPDLVKSLVPQFELKKEIEF